MANLTPEMIQWLNEQVGVREEPMGSNNVIYNRIADAEMWSGYHPRVGQPWCGTFLDHFCRRFNIDYPGILQGGHFYTPSSWNSYKAAGRALGPDAQNVEGCVVFFQWTKRWGSPIVVGPSTHHIEIVAYTVGNDIVTYGANVNDQVLHLRRTRENVVGFGVLGYPRPQVVDPGVNVLAALDAMFRSIPYMGSVSRTMNTPGEEVKAIQWALASEGVLKDPFGQVIPIEIDGDFGPQTERAVRLFQVKRQLYVDGVVGPITWAALRLHPI